MPLENDRYFFYRREIMKTIINNSLTFGFGIVILTQITTTQN